MMPPSLTIDKTNHPPETNHQHHHRTNMKTHPHRMNSTTTRRACLIAAAGLIFSLSHVALADVPKGWETFKGAYFEIGVPPGFTAKPIRTNDHTNGVVLVNAGRELKFMVFSPQWDGEAPFKKAAAGEKVASRNVKKAGKETAEDIAITAVDGSYTRYVLSQTFVDEANSTRTNKTFGLQLSNGDNGDAKQLYAKWKKTLSQFAD